MFALRGRGHDGRVELLTAGDLLAYLRLGREHSLLGVDACRAEDNERHVRPCAPRAELVEHSEQVGTFPEPGWQSLWAQMLVDQQLTDRSGEGLEQAGEQAAVLGKEPSGKSGISASAGMFLAICRCSGM